MQIIQKADALKSHLAAAIGRQASIGLVPTMGALHSGHLALVNRAASDNDVVVVSIFVNPTQFNNPDDLKKYPRTLARDVEQLKAFQNLIIFTPDVEDMYGEKVSAEEFTFGALEQVMEGKHRPGHFKGVATIVKKFFEIVQPHKAYFGQKDYQQLLIIKSLVKQLNLPIEIVGHPVERASNGLALSSRNQLLSDNAKGKAGTIYDCMVFIKNHITNQQIPHLIEQAKKQLLSSGLEPEYITVADAESLAEIEKISDAEHARVFVAAHLENVRLIDNLLLF